MPRYRKLTPQQRGVWAALNRLGGELTVTPDNARPLHALKRRGWVRFARQDGVKVARLRGAIVRRRRGSIFDWLLGRAPGRR